MQFSVLKKSNEKISKLGFGCMRFPQNSEKKIDRTESEKLLLYAIENGLNYLDTAWPYHGGESEEFLGEFLEKHNLRKKIKLATKLPTWLLKEEKDLEEYFDKQKKKLKTDYFDFYLIHALNEKSWKNAENLNVVNFIEKKLASGEIKNIGFSFHDKYDVFETIVDSYNWDFCLIQLNFMDQEHQQGVKGLNYAYEKGIEIFIMEPLRGGMLVNHIPDEVKKIWERAEKKRNPVEWAFSWLYNKPEISMILSGMSDMKQVKENIEIASNNKENSLTSDELNLISEVKKEYESRIKVNCTDCKYCLPCPHGVAIPNCFRFYNNAFIYEDKARMKSFYNGFLKKENQAHNCVECGDCLEKCPQKIEIIDELRKVKEFFK